MNSFFCQHCGERLFFENTFCLSCNASLGFLPDRLEIAAIDGNSAYRKCGNFTHENACNWMIPESDPDAYCLSCRLNRVIPDLSDPNRRTLWLKLESAKRRLIYTFLKLQLQVVPKSADPVRGLAFEFLADPPSDLVMSDRILTGHLDGVITLNLNEADDAWRERTRLDMQESYRTLLGHFRHESGHYFWDILVRPSTRIGEVRALFGDERQDYQAALQGFYLNGPPADWGSLHVTPYASSHPWEDWAETWAHYLHIVDTLETAATGGVQIHLNGGHVTLGNPYELDFPAIRENWHALRFVVNSLNRSMGMPDPYPFILSDTVTRKLAFIHEWIASYRMPAIPPPS